MAEERFYTFEEWQRLSPELKEYLNYKAAMKMNTLDDRYAAKKTETALMAMFGFILIGFLTAVINMVFVK